MNLVNLLWFVDIVVVFPILVGIIVIETFKILFLRKKIEIKFVNILFSFACIHTLLTILAIIKI